MPLHIDMHRKSSGFTLGTHGDISNLMANVFKLLLDKISWQRRKIDPRKPKCLVAISLATLELSQFVIKGCQKHY